MSNPKDNYAQLGRGLAGEYRQKDMLSHHTSFKIGGPANLLAIPYGEEALGELLKRIKRNRMRSYILGNGSNLLALDNGFPGVVIKITKGFKTIRQQELILEVGAGIPLSYLVSYCLEQGLSGMEWAVGIPGAMGGALVMNAGAYGGQMSDVVTGVWGFMPDGRKRTIPAKQIKFAYRHAEYPKGFVITGVKLKMKRGDRARMRQFMTECLAKRKYNQPLTLPSAGCIFKNPAGDSARRLIAVAGCKGRKLGGAAVSTKHANFIVNQGGARAADVLKLINLVQKQTWKNLKIKLVPEVKILGA
jgi:UDP-N-acetylmuramate dehydrogenase